MHFSRTPILGLLLVLGISTGEARAGQDAVASSVPSSQVTASPQRRVLAIPPGLPRYGLAVRIDPASRKVIARERVVFTNRSKVPVSELVFHVYPRYKVPEKDRLKLARTMEVLRLSPEEAIDQTGQRMTVSQVMLAGAPVHFTMDSGDGTILTVPLDHAVEPGEQVSVVIDFTIDLPEKWGRWGHHHGVTYLLNWYPVLAHHDDQGWDKTPFVPWHQPWYQEAGHYTVIADLPGPQIVASSGRIVGRQVTQGGWQRLTIEASPARDFALVCSDRFKTWERTSGSTTIRVHGLPGHEANAQLALDYACEVFPIYERWFGPYCDREFEIAPSFFGWNGNECSGLVLLDDRVMRLTPAGKRYIDHLVTHETCHQWWWNTVGTNGFAETFMDEGLVNCFTALRLNAKYGRNGPLITWPRGFDWLPTIGREDLRLGGYYGWRRKGGGGPIIQDLNSMGDLLTLFSLAYDRGGKVVEMIRNRLGEEQFFAFFQKLYNDYAYGTLRYADFRRQLIAFDPEGDWERFLGGWIESHQETDWVVQQVQVSPLIKADTDVRRVTVELEQKGQMIEPTVVLLRTQGGEMRVPIWPDRGSYEVPGARVQKQGAQWAVTLDAPGEPTQIEIDPDHALLDAHPENNRWKPEISWRLTPLLTPLDTSSQFQPYDRVSAIVGPFVDQYARAGLKAGLQRLNRWQVIAWAGTEPALREAIFGGQVTLYHLPAINWATGFFYEQGLYNFHNDSRHSGGRFFVRKRLLESSSFIVDDPVFVEFYYGLGNEFWPGDDGRPVNTYLGAVGARYRQNTQFPYWDPVQGGLIDIAAEYGNALIASNLDYARVYAEYALVRTVPESWGILPNSRFAFRAYGGYSWPSNASLFRLGGGQRLRALDLTSQEGSSLWLVTVEWRFPIWREINHDVLYNMLTFRHLYGALFYDVGQSHLSGRWSPVVHGPGFGLRWDVILFSFLERATLRLDIAQPIGLPGGPVLWFGINQVF